MSEQWLDEQMRAVFTDSSLGDWADPSKLRRIGTRRRKRRMTARLIAPLAVIAATVAGTSSLWWPSQRTGSQVEVGTGPGSEECASLLPSCGAATAAELADGSWSRLPTAPIEPRSGQSAVWTGRELIIWGGARHIGSGGSQQVEPFSDGASYDPVTGRWQLLPSSPLSPRMYASSVWTGSQVIIWGGNDPRYNSYGPFVRADGASFDPTTGTWKMLPAAPIQARAFASAFWTGSQMIVFGGQGRQPGYGQLLDGAVYTPTSNTWRRIPPMPAGSGTLVGVTSVWDGQQLLAWATYQSASPTGATPMAAAWNPSTGAWTSLPNPPHRVATYGATATWTGQQVLLLDGSNCLPSMSCLVPLRDGAGSGYTPRTGQWSVIPDNVVAGSAGPTAWTGQALAALNAGSQGSTAGQSVLMPGDAAAYDPATQTWTDLPRGPLGALDGASVFWTGKQLLVWGGGASSGSNQGEALTARTANTGRGQGTIAGTLEAVGGPAPGTPRPLRGTITMTNTLTGHTITQAVGAAGTFSVSVPAGSYTITGRSPLYDNGTVDCTQAGTTTVTPNSTSRATITCQLP